MTAPLADILRELLGEEGHDISLSDEAAARIVEGLLASADLATAPVSTQSRPRPFISRAIKRLIDAVILREACPRPSGARFSANRAVDTAIADLLQLGRA